MLFTDIQLNATELLTEIRDGIQFDRKNALVDIPCGHTENHCKYISFSLIDWFFLICFCTFLTAANLVNYSASNDSLKYLVFRDLWRRGKFVTCGDAFGADFLLYPGDPLIYHASHIVVLLNSSKIKPLDMITKVRLSVTINKLCFFCDLDDECGPLNYAASHIVILLNSWKIKPLYMITKVHLSVTGNKLRAFACLDEKSDSETNSVKKIVYHTMAFQGNRNKVR